MGIWNGFDECDIENHMDELDLEARQLRSELEEED